MLGFATDFQTLATRRRSQGISLISAAGLGPNVSFSRASTAFAYGGGGDLIAYGPDQPRFDHDPLTGAPRGLLVEPASSNLMYHSVATTGTWVLNGGSFNDLSLNALGMFPGLRSVSGGAAYHRCNHPGIDLTAGQSYVLTVWMRAGAAQTFRVALRTSAGAQTNYGGTFAAHGASSQGGSGHVTLYDMRAFMDGTYRLRLGFVANDSTSYAIGVGPYSDTAGDDLIILGQQLELGSVPSSYIATDGSEVSRAADMIGLTGLNGLHDLSVIYGDGTQAVFPAVMLSEGYWPPVSQRHIRKMVATPS